MPPTNEPAPPQNPYQVQPPQPPIGNGVLPPPVPSPEAYAYRVPSSKRKKILVTVLVLVLILGGGAAAYFGYVLPNSPQYVLRKALGNTATGYDRLVTYADEQKDLKGTKTEGSFKVDGDFVADGTFAFTNYEQNSLLKLDVGAAGLRFGLESRLMTVANATMPDLYVKATGIKSLQGLLGTAVTQEVSQMLSELDDQWIVIDHTAFDQIKSEVTETGAPSLNRDDMIELARVFGRVNRDYLWTDDKERAVFTLVETVGSEDKEGQKSFRYKMGYNKAHLKAYLSALKNELQQTKLAEIAPDEDVGKLLQLEETLKAIDKLKGTGTADVWVDQQTKLVRAVRFTDPKKPDDHVEIGLNYTGGDDYPFYLNLKSSEDGQAEGKLIMTLNTKANTLKFDLRGEFEGEGEKVVFTATAKTEVNNQAVNVQKPAGAKSWLELLGGLPLPMTSDSELPLSPTGIEI